MRHTLKIRKPERFRGMEYRIHRVTDPGDSIYPDEILYILTYGDPKKNIHLGTIIRYNLVNALKELRSEINDYIAKGRPKPLVYSIDHETMETIEVDSKPMRWSFL